MTPDDAQASLAESRLTFAEWCALVGAGDDLDRIKKHIRGLLSVGTFSTDDEFDRVMSHKEWCKAAGISDRHGHDLIDRGDGPPIVQLSPGRIGVRVCDYRAWLASRVRKPRTV
jgi:hypothetical protein